MRAMHETLAFLDGLTIPYRLLQHGPVWTIDDCLRLEGIDWSETVVPRNALLGPASTMRSATFAENPVHYVLSHPQTRFALVLMMPKQPLLTGAVSKALGTSRLSFAPKALLPLLLGVAEGAVSPLGLPQDKANRVSLAIDGALRDTPVWAMHPCVNTASVLMQQADFLGRFLPAIGREPVWLPASTDPA